MTRDQLAQAYGDYIACLNARDWQALSQYVDEDVQRNGKLIGIDGYRQMLEENVTEIPDLHFSVELLVVDPPYVACRLRFNCTPKEMFLGLHVGGAKVSFSENVFYEFADQKISRVWSVVDKAAIEEQLSTAP